MTDYIIPLFIALIIIFGAVKKVRIFDEFTAGAKENIGVGLEILPTLIAMITAIGMFKASGAMDFLGSLLSPVTSLLGFPEECLPLALMRPVSGSGSLAMLEAILTENHPDSFAGRVASVISGSTETTFYTIAVYFGATKIKRTRHTLISALSADFTGFIVSVLAVRLFFG